MSELAGLRRKLRRLRAARARVRIVTALAMLVAVVLWVLGVMLVLDVQFHLDVTQRLIVSAFGLLLIGWLFRRRCLPLLSRRESVEQVALLVERQQGIRNDLIAALQFERTGASRGASRRLADAVVRRVSEANARLNVFEGFSRRPMRRPAALALTTLVVLGGAAALYPEHAAVFADRLRLGSRHYPTDTRIRRIAVNGREVLERRRDGHRPREAMCAEGAALEFRVECAGSIPAEGEVRLSAARGGAGRPVALTRVASEGETPPGPTDVVVFVGRVERMVDDVEYRVSIGDAWTDTSRVIMTPLPVIETRLKATPPDYARGREQPTVDPSGRNLEVLAGSKVDLEIVSAGGKPLTSAWVDLRSATDGPRRIRLARTDDTGLRWALRDASSPLRDVRDPVRFEIQVNDRDGLRLETPIEGRIGLKPDRPPTGSCDLVHRVVLPTARPILEYRVSDDYGIARVRLTLRVERARRPDVPPDGSPVTMDSPPVPLTMRDDLLPARRLPWDGRYTLDLSPYGLEKGDRLELSMEVIDHRGKAEGESYRCDPLVLEVSDESGVLAAIAEADERTEEQLSDIIEQQLGIGESP